MTTLAVVLEARDSLNVALLQAGVPIVHAVQLTQLGERDAALVEVRVGAADHPRRLADLDRGILHVELEEADLMGRGIALERAVRTDLEGGANTLFVAIGLLKWFDANAPESARLAPLLLVPARIEVNPASRRVRITRIEEEPRTGRPRTPAAAVKARIEWALRCGGSWPAGCMWRPRRRGVARCR